MNIARLDDAKAFRAMGLPVYRPVVDFLSPQAEKKIIAVHKATHAFGNAVLPWMKKQMKKRAKVFQARRDLVRALSQARKWCEKTDNEAEAIAVAAIIEPCRLVWAQWDEIFTALERGEVQHISVGEGEPWPLGPFPEY
jgi:hypothetical protein